MDRELARRMWLIGERIHALTYFAQPAFDAWAEAGLRGFWRGYFATRGAPLGQVGPEVVTATFFGFAPSMVARAIPSVWEMAAPERAIEARLAGMDAALADVVGTERLDGSDVRAAVEALREAVESCPSSGRALFAANLALHWPEVPHLAVWHGLTCLREHRGDGHNAALVAEALDGCQANVLAGAVGGPGREVIQPARGWSDDQWSDGSDALATRGLVIDGVATDEGRNLHARVEERTDELALVPWAQLGDTRTQQVAATLLPWAEAIQAAGVIRQPNPMGLPPLPAR